MAPLTLACLRMVRKMEKENRNGLKKELTPVNSKMITWKGMVSMNGMIKECIKVTGNKV